MNLLFIEDDPAYLPFLKKFARGCGFSTAWAATGPRGLFLARKLHPAVLVLDCVLAGGMSGETVARSLKADPATRDIFILAISGRLGDDEDDRRMRRAGAEYFLRKAEFSAGLPCVARMLRAAIERRRPSRQHRGRGAARVPSGADGRRPDGISIDRVRLRLSRGGKESALLSSRELALYEELHDRRGRTAGYEDLILQFRALGFCRAENGKLWLADLKRRLGRKLKDDFFGVIDTDHDKGYRLSFQ